MRCARRSGTQKSVDLDTPVGYGSLCPNNFWQRVVYHPVAGVLHAFPDSGSGRGGVRFGVDGWRPLPPPSGSVGLSPCGLCGQEGRVGSRPCGASPCCLPRLSLLTCAYNWGVRPLRAVSPARSACHGEVFAQRNEDEADRADEGQAQGCQEVEVQGPLITKSVTLHPLKGNVPRCSVPKALGGAGRLLESWQRLTLPAAAGQEPD